MVVQLRHRLRLFGCNLLVALCVLGVSTARADDAKAPVITVRAGLAEPAPGRMDTRQSVSGENLQSAGIDDATDLAKVVPGLSVSEGAATGVPAFTLRGAGLNDITSNAESSVALSQDDVVYPYAVMMRGLLFDLERVDIFKGPQGDRGGRSATGGRINFKSAAPVAETIQRLDWSVDQFGLHDLQGAVSGALGQGLSGRLAGRALWSDEGYQKSVSRPNDRLGARDEWAVRGSVAFESSNLQATLRAQWDRDRSENLAPAAYDGRKGGFDRIQPLPTPYDAGDFFTDGDLRAGDWGADFRPRRDNDMRSLSARILWSPREGAVVSSVTGFGAFDRDERLEIAGIAPEDTRWRADTHIRAISQDLRIDLTTERVHYELGGYYAQDRLRENILFGLRQSFFNRAIGVDEVLLRSRQKSRMAAIYGGATWSAADALRLFAFARFTDSAKDWRACPFDSGDGSVAFAWNNVLTPFVIRPNNLPDPGIVATGQCALYNDLAGQAGFGTFEPFEDSSDFSRWSGRAGLEAELSQDTVFRASVANAGKAGGYNGITTQTFSQAAPYGPESVTAFEAGLKKQFNNGAGTIGLSAFFNLYRNKQETSYAVTPVGNIPGLTNIPRSEIFGLELDAAMRITTRLSVQFGAAFTDAKIRRYLQIDPIASVYPVIVRVDSKGNSLPNAPRWQTNGALNYERPIWREYLVGAQAGFSYRSKSFGTADGRNIISDALLVDGQISLSDHEHKRALSIWGRNIFNEYYWTAAYRSNGVFSRVNGRPATFGVTISLRR